MKVVVVLTEGGKEFFSADNIEWDVEASPEVAGTLVVSEWIATKTNSKRSKLVGAFAPGQWSHVRYVDETKPGYITVTTSLAE